MGQIIQLPILPAGYPDIAATLDTGEGILLIAIRWWVVDFRQRDDPLPHLCEFMGTAGVHDGAFAVDQLMAVFVRSARRPLSIHHPRCRDLSGDEKHLLNAASLVQTGQSKLAERALRAVLLSAEGAECALGPLHGLGAVFAEAGLFLRRRAQSGEGQAPTEAVEPYFPSAFGCNPPIEKES